MPQSKKQSNKSNKANNKGNKLGNIQKIVDTVAEIKDRFGEGAIMKLGDATKVNVDAIPTGSISLDIALGVGGIPKGRIIEIYGQESSGKSTLALHLAANCQKRGGVAAFIDAEHALDPEYAKHLGVRVNDLLISQPDSGEEALEIAESLIRSGAIDLVVIDSVAALVPRAEIDGEIGDTHIALQARLMSQALRKLTPLTSKSGSILVFLNQTRMKIGVFFGNPETTPGGKALKFFSSVRIELRRAAKIMQGNDLIGNKITAKVVKNKVAVPFKATEFDIIYNEGISYLGDLLNTGVKYGIVERGGSWYRYNGKNLGAGLEASKRFIEENSKIAKDIEAEVKKKAKGE